jgi:GntR family transcriptional regulator, transcriptional repressor for pyruvate dehydrogenase complex
VSGKLKATKADMVAEVLRHEIAVGAYPVGSELPSEGRLSERFGISRPSSREALRMLESEGMIRVTRGSRGGAKVLLPPLRSIARDMGVYLQMRDVELGDLYAALLTYEPVAADQPASYSCQ